MEIGLVSYTRALELRESVTQENIVAYRGSVKCQKSVSYGLFDNGKVAYQI